MLLQARGKARPKSVAALLCKCVGSHTSLGPRGQFRAHSSSFCWPLGNRSFTSMKWQSQGTNSVDRNLNRRPAINKDVPPPGKLRVDRIKIRNEIFVRIKGKGPLLNYVEKSYTGITIATWLFFHGCLLEGLKEKLFMIERTQDWGVEPRFNLGSSSIQWPRAGHLIHLVSGSFLTSDF